MTKTKFQKIEDVMKKHLGDDLIVYSIRSLHSGRNQREEGAWSWVSRTNKGDVGSYQSVTELLKCKRIECFRMHGDLEIMGE